MTVKGKGNRVAGKAPASLPSSSSKRKNPLSVVESSSAQPKKARSDVPQFVDDAAADADHEGKDEDEDLEWEDLEDFEFELPVLTGKEVKNLSKGSGKSGLIPFFIKEEEIDDDELEEAIKERYLRGSQFVSYDEDVKVCDDSELVAHTMKDLTFWRVKCMIGQERQAAFCLMQKFVDLQKIGKMLQIFSVIAIEHVKGFVYIEADFVSNVFEACNGLCILYPSRIELVPSSEAPSLLANQNKACGICKGMWVRMKCGKYKGDLAEVVFVNDVKKRVTIKLVPRIDLQAIAKKFGGGTSLKASPIPAPRLISLHELEDFRPHLQVIRDLETGEIFEVLDGLMLKDGYLYKKVSTCSLIYWGVQPSSAELVKFEEMGKDVVKDVSWLSSVYKARMKKKLHETSNQKNGDKSKPKDGDKQGSGFQVDDLVLFGKKGCGIIVDKENDSFKILKGDVSGSKVVTIRIREIRKNCVDKVFTAADRCYKNISIDDIVKVSEGPQEGREGIVRHIYNGILFIHDECQSENNGFFCAKSGMCDLVKKSREFYGGKSGSKAGASFAQSPIKLPEQADNSHSFSRNRQSNTRGTFSVGQTLRICKGPLKGYLCRAVKLDSLAKFLTVDEKLLSSANSKRDDSTAMPSDISGTQEELSIGGVQDDRRGLEMDNCQMNDGMSSFGRDSQDAPSSSNFAFALENDNKVDQDPGADPGGCKLQSLNGAQEQGVNNSWGKALCPIAEQSSWNKMDSENIDGDARNKASTKSDTASVAWKNDNPSRSQETEQTWSMKGGSNGWGVAAKNAIDGCSDSGGWRTAELTDPGDRQTLGENCWNRPGKASTVSITETSGWEKSKPPSSDTGGSWTTKGVSAEWNKEASGKDKSGSFGGQSSNFACQKSDGDKRHPWFIMFENMLKFGDNWGQFTASDEKSPVASNSWDRWDKANNFEGHGLENHKEWKASNNWQKDQHDANFGKPTNSDWSEGSGWSQGHSRNGNVKNWEQGNYWNQQRDFDGGRGSSMGRERGRYGGRGSRNENDFEKPVDSYEGWRSGKGGGRFGCGGGGYRRDNSDDTGQLGRDIGRDQGQFESSDWRSRCGGCFGCGAGGYRRDNSGDTRQLGRGIDRGRSRDHGQFESSDRRSRCERVDDGGFPNRRPSSCGGDEDSGWGKSALNNGKISAGATDGNSGWSSRKSFGGVSTPQVTDPQNAIGSENEPTFSKLTWSRKEKDSFGNQSVGGGNGGGNIWSKQKTSDDYEKPALSNTLEGSKEGGYQVQSGNWRGRSEFGRDRSSIWGDQGRPSSLGKCKPASWTTEVSGWTSASAASKGESSKSGWEADVKSKPSSWMDEGSGWTAASATSKSESSNCGWVSASDFGSQGASVLGSASAKGFEATDGTGRAGGWSSIKEAGSSSGKKDDPLASSNARKGGQESSWNKEGCGWNTGSSPKAAKEAYDDESAWNKTTVQVEENTERNELGSGRDSVNVSKQGALDVNGSSWNGDRDRLSGGRRWGNSFSGRGYGLGRNSGGRNSFAWNSGDGSGNEGNDNGGSWNRRKGSFEGEKGSWNIGGHAEMGSQGSWKADVKSKPASLTTEGSGWTAASAASKGESSKSGWEADVKSKPASWTEEWSGWTAASAASKGESRKSGWDSATDFGSQGASVWGSASAKGFEATDGTGRAGGWSSIKEAGSSSGQKDDPLASSNARKGGQESIWNKEGCGWNTGSSPKSAKEAYDDDWSAWIKRLNLLGLL